MTFLDNSWSVTTKFIEFVLNAPIQYKHWWLNLVAEAPAHVFVETCLTFFIVWLLLIRRTVDPSRSSDNKTLNSKEITELIDSWEPESIVPTLGDEEEEIAENIQVFMKNIFYLAFNMHLDIPDSILFYFRLSNLLLETMLN